MTAVLTRALVYGGIVAAVCAAAGAGIGWLVAGGPGLAGGLLGAALSAVFLGLTTVSVLVGQRFTRDDPTNPLFFAVVIGALGVKFVIFLVFMIWLRGQTWLDLGVFAFTTIAAVVGSLIADAVALSRTRVPYVGDVRLPGDDTPKP
ncbi:MAG: hypothetical protein AB7K08_08120 [Microbacteriaceae bacterium]